MELTLRFSEVAMPLRPRRLRHVSGLHSVRAKMLQLLVSLDPVWYSGLVIYGGEWMECLNAFNSDPNCVYRCSQILVHIEEKIFQGTHFKR